LSSKAKPLILIISGPSGAGKTTLSLALIASIPNTIIATSHTTRPPRPGDKDGDDYFFVSEETFKSKISSGAMLEYAEVYGNLYGTSRDSIENELSAASNVILDIDWQGASRIKAIYPEAISFFILPPAGKEAQNRLQSRQQDNEETIKLRMSTYQEQISHQNKYDHILTNTDIEQTTQQLLDILSSYQ